MAKYKDCPFCHGKGLFMGVYVCDFCNGSGRVPRESVFKEKGISKNVKKIKIK